MISALEMLALGPGLWLLVVATLGYGIRLWVDWSEP